MLKSYLTSLPLTKFVLIEDSLEEPGQQIFDFLIRSHLKSAQNRIRFFSFHGSITRVLERFEHNLNCIVHDFTSNVCGWEIDKLGDSFADISSKLTVNDVVVIDSLAHAIFQYGLTEVYRVCNALKNQSVSQIITLLHTDLLDNKRRVNEIFQHLCTLSLIVEPKFVTKNRRVQYTYKKLGGKIVKQIEEYTFEYNDFVTSKIEKLDPKKLLEKSVPPEVNPETLSTFKIGLSDKEKESRDQLILPYLPTNDVGNTEQGGKIIYQLDEVDDWDEEDPDDDLDI